MKSIWAYISEQVASSSNLNVDHRDIALTGNLLRLNDLLQYLGFNNQQAADSLAIRIRHKLLQIQSLDIPSDLLAPRKEELAQLEALDSAQQTIISYAKQCNRY